MKLRRARQKTIFPGVGESPREVNSSRRPPPPPKWRAKDGGPHMGTRRNNPPLITWRPATGHVTGGEARGEIRHFSNNSLTKQYYKIPFSHNRRVMLAPTLLQCQSLPISSLWAVRKENVSYIVTRAYKRPAEMVPLSQSVTLRSTGNISAEGRVFKNKAGHNSTRGPVSSLLFFPLRILLHTVYISTSFCGLRL